MHKYIVVYIFLLWFFGFAHTNAKPKNIISDSLQQLRFEVNGESFSMQRVEGGIFLMGGTSEQHREPISTDLPVHTVALDAYYIAHMEVTQALWKAVMIEWEFVEELYFSYSPMSYVSWYDCQEFVRRLDSITGMPFRLPTEAEWEFAARGGNKSMGTRFAGSNVVEEVSWGFSNAGCRKHTIGTKMPNELGLYDMTGNVSEWCADWYAPYYIGTEPNPQGTQYGEWKVVRGGSFDNCKENSYISRREYQMPTEATNYCGLRLALTLPNEPTLLLTEEPELVKKIKLKNLRLKLFYVNSDTPYYISEDAISWRVWNKVMNWTNNQSWSQAVIDKTDSEWIEFLERCRRKSNEPLVFASENEVLMAIEKGISHHPKIKKEKTRHWEKSTRTIQRHRRNTMKAQKWADLIGVKIAETDDPTLLLYTQGEKATKPRWFVIRCSNYE